MTWKRVEDIYKENGLILALGAGVSLGAGLPTWVGLLQKLGKVCYGENGVEIIDELRLSGFSLPSIASIIRATRSSDKSFIALVRNELYRDFPFYKKDIKENNIKDFVEYIQNRPNQTLRAVASLCSIWDQKQKVYKKNSRVHAIVNFNIDAVLRVYTQARYGSPLTRTVERPSKSSDPERINTYHMHGFLRFDRRANNLKKETDKLVLTEQEYFDFFNSPTSLFNYTFLHLLREHSCLFIGLSMQDDNIRRLLHYSRKERVQAYIEEGESKAEAKGLRHFVIMKRYGSKTFMQKMEESLNSLGAQVLWLDDFSEIVERLKRIYSAAEDDWNKVF